jgi:hypothetical protein
MSELPNNDFLRELLIKALEYYDHKRVQYKHLLDIEVENINIDFNNRLINFNDDKYKFEILGYFDTLNIWIWGWCLKDFDVRYDINCKSLLDYGIKLKEDTNMLIKSILINSRIQIEEEEQLYINLAIYNYLLKERIKFIYRHHNYYILVI